LMRPAESLDRIPARMYSTDPRPVFNTRRQPGSCPGCSYCGQRTGPFTRCSTSKERQFWWRRQPRSAR